MPPFTSTSTSHLRQRPAAPGPRVHRTPLASVPTQAALRLGPNGFEERSLGGRWVIRGRVPGILPARDLVLELSRHTLLLAVRGRGHLRQVFSVPAGLSADDVQVTYVGDLLTLSLPLSAVRPARG